MPGPGDPETWGPCTNHPNDPRTPDFDTMHEEKKQEMVAERSKNIGWFREALGEAADAVIEKLIDALTKDTGPVAQIVQGIVSEYVEPNDWEVGEALEMDAEFDDRV